MLRAPQSRRGTRFAVLLAAVCLLAAACGGGGQASSASSSPGTFRFVMGAPGSSGALTQAALAQLNERYGYQAEFVEVTDSEVAASGIASGKFQFGAGVSATVMQAVQSQDAPLTFLVNQLKMQWMLVAKEGIEGCQDLDGVRMGLHSPGGVSTALFNAWLEQNCDTSAVSPKLTYVAGSPNRSQGLAAGELDAAMVELEDELPLPDEGFRRLANFGESFPEVKQGPVYGNSQYIKDHPKVVMRLVAELVRVNRKANEDPAYFASLIKKYRPEFAETASVAADAYVESGLLPKDGDMSLSDVQATIDLFTETGTLEPGLKASEITDLTYLERALKQLEEDS